MAEHVVAEMAHVAQTHGEASGCFFLYPIFARTDSAASCWACYSVIYPTLPYLALPVHCEIVQLCYFCCSPTSFNSAVLQPLVLKRAVVQAALLDRGVSL
jgi:hypothetical protein